MNNTSETDSAPPRPAAETAAAAAEAGELLGIGAAAAQLGVSERRCAITSSWPDPPACTPGGLRRYSADDIARVTRIRELQDLLGLNLDEIAIVLSRETGWPRSAHLSRRADQPVERRQLIERACPCKKACARRSRPSAPP